MLICLAGTELGPRTQAARNIGHPIPFDAWDCTRPTRTIVTRRSLQCRLDDAVKMPALVTLVQRNRAIQIKGFECSVLASLATHYCGWLSYTQALPLGYVSMPQKLTGQECAEIVAKKAWTLEDGVTLSLIHI